MRGWWIFGKKKPETGEPIKPGEVKKRVHDKVKIRCGECGKIAAWNTHKSAEKFFCPRCKQFYPYSIK